MEPPPPGLLPLLSGLSLHDATDLVRQSSEGIAEGVLQIYRIEFRKIYQGTKFDSMVIGMLYMTRTGLSAWEMFYLPSIPHIHELLPSETYLNCLGVSSKVICDTENVVKACIRVFTDSQSIAKAVELTPRWALCGRYGVRNRSRAQNKAPQPLTTR